MAGRRGWIAVSLGIALTALASSTVRTGAALARPAACATPLARLAKPAPNVMWLPLDQALRTLRRDGMRASIAAFPGIVPAMPEQGHSRLQTYRVAMQVPRPGTRVRPGRPVRLAVNRPRFRGPFASLAIRTHVGDAVVPDLVGKRYGDVFANDPGVSGVYVALGHTGALHASASGCGLDAFVVASQSPAPGTRVPWEGLHGTGVLPRLSTVTVDLVSRG
jgi:hypothetical protein